MKFKVFAVLAALVSAVCLPAVGEAGPRLRGVLLIDFAAGIPNPTPAALVFVVPAQLKSTVDLNFLPPNGKRGLQVPERYQGAFTIDLSNNPACNQLAGALLGDTNGGRALVRLETRKRKEGGIFEGEVTSGAACSLYEGNVTSGADPFAGDLECALIAEAFVWQAQVGADLASTVPQFFGIDPASSAVITKVFNL